MVVEKWMGFGFRDKRSILYLLSLIIASGYVIDIFSLNNVILRNYNVAALALTVISFVLHSLRTIDINRTFHIIIYTLVACVIGSYLSETEHTMDAEIFHSAAIIGALIPVTGFVLGKKHTLYLGAILLLFNFSALVLTNNAYFYQNQYLIVVLLIGYTLGMYHLINLIERGAENRKEFLVGLEQQNSDNLFINSLSLELMASTSDDDIAPIMLSKIKDYSNAVFALFSVYDPEKKCLIVKHIESDDLIIKTAVKIAGEEILNTSSPVDDVTYQMMLKEKIGISHSLNDITFGAITQGHNRAIKRVTGLHTFIAIVHEVSNQLYGTTMIGLKRNQKLPTLSILKSYSYVTSLTLKRNVAERALQASEAKLRQITDQISDVVFVSDMAFNLCYISPSIEKMTGETPETHMGKPLHEKYPQESLDKILFIYKEEFERENDPNIDRNRTRYVDLEMYNNAGEIIDISTHATYIRDEQGKPIGVQGIIRNISKRKKFERALKESEKELKRLVADKDRFMRIISHDLRSPFQTLIGFSEVLANNLPDYSAEEISNGLMIINQTSQNTYDLLGDLLLWAKAQSGKLVLEPQYISLANLCHSVIDESLFRAQQKNLTIKDNVPGHIQLMADCNVLKTVLRNLISNAIKFSFPGSEVVVMAESTENTVIMGISDTGVGISPERQQQMWDDNQSSTTFGTANEQGTGNGLMLCKELVEKHGGKIWVESNVNQGSTFKIELPIKNEPPALYNGKNGESK